MTAPAASEPDTRSGSREAAQAPAPTVGVLLPLRLETRFTGSELRLRVIPDEPWFDRHDHLASPAELDSLERYRTAAGDHPDSPEGQAAWRGFARQHGPGRAAWLLRTFPEARDPGVAGGLAEPGARRRVLRPAQVREEARFTELAGFPDTLQVWLARAGGAPALAATLTVDHARLRLDPVDPGSGEERWWESFPEAVKAGLATTIDLGQRNDDIDVLSVVGLGRGDPKALFAAHRDAGQLGLLPVGVPTNSVDGELSADLGEDPDQWRALLGRAATATERRVSVALTGDAATLGPLPGDAPPHGRWARRLVAALWPALWGHGLADVLGLEGKAVAQAADWAAENLEPAGPFPPLRVGTQPYGLLPATALRDWVPAPGDPVVEGRILPALQHLRARWAAAAEAAARTFTGGADAGRLLDALRHPYASPGYALERLRPMELWTVALLATGTHVAWPDLLRRWGRRFPVAGALGLRPVRRYGGRGTAKRLRLPLVTPPALPAGATTASVLRSLSDTAKLAPAQFANSAALDRDVLKLDPDSLLLRLTVRSLQLAIGEVGGDKQALASPALEPVAADRATKGRLATAIRAVDRADLGAQTPTAAAFRRVAAAVGALAAVPQRQLERLLPLVVDCATHRVDPWVSAPARRRLHALLGLAGDATGPATATLTLGAYGWVDRPRPGTPGPTGGGLLHAPSEPQAATAALLRDRALGDHEGGRWHMDLTSTSVRDAAALAEEVRRGAHLAEALGRAVERAVANPARVAALRLRFPVRAEHAGRRVCDGQRVLAANQNTLGLPNATLAQLVPLRAALDAYGDLLVADAVHDVTSGRAELAGAAMDAAAGLAKPPDLDVLRTRREGRAVESVAVLVLPGAAQPPLPAGPDALAEVRPAALADPAADALVRARTGQPATWTWQVTGAGGGAPATVTLADLGLQPADALALPLGDLERLVMERAARGEGASITDRDGSARYERAVRLVALLGQVPATAPDLAEAAPGGIAGGAGAAVAADLLDRYTALRRVAAALADRLERAAATGTTPGEQAAALRLATRWGIAPTPDPGLAAAAPLGPSSASPGPAGPLAASGLFGGPARPGGARDPNGGVAGQLVRARRLLLDRLAAAPDPATAAGLDHLALARAAAALASPTGQVAVLARLRRDALPALKPGSGGGSGGADLEATWLRLVAAVRAPLARLEAAQLTAGTPAGTGPAFRPWANRPLDPWQTSVGDPRRLVAAWAPATLDLATTPPGQNLAVGLLDRLAETIPASGHTTSAAFGFDAPGARAQQAILLAVPPDLTKPLDLPTLAQVVAEARELAHARMATPVNLGAAGGLIPLALFPTSGETAIPLERG